MKRTLLFASAAIAVGAAFAENEKGRHPTKPDVAVPRVTYRSAFEDYRSYRDTEPAPWREVNEEVARIGGHAGVMRAGKEKKQ
jgi:hypothetical protein